LPMIGDHSMLQATVARFAGSFGFAAPIIVGGEDHRFLISDQLAEAGCTPQAIILEPQGRNTAAAIALAAHLAIRLDPDAVLAVAGSSPMHLKLAMDISRWGRRCLAWTVFTK